MKVLVVGNSQAGVLKRARVQAGAALATRFAPDFYCVPGGQGPYLTVRDDRLVLTLLNKDFPPYVDPADTADRALSDYDAIVVSALGYVDGGFKYDNKIIAQGQLAEFGPRPTDLTDALITRACLADIVRGGLRVQHGFRFLADLCAAYAGPVLVQPFPYPSDDIIHHPGWVPARLYDDPVGFYRLLCQLRHQAMTDLCAQAGAELLPCPDPAFAQKCFTPAALMNPTDAIHPGLDYGVLVLQQLVDRLTNGQGPGYRGIVTGAAG